MEEKSARELAAASQPHDSHGHFAPKPHEPQPLNQSTNPVTDFLHKEMSVNSTNKDDTLVDVHVNNPLRKITHLLEEIKRQKAFSFNIKGSLGLAGIVLALTAFGIFGGTKAFCSKGEQSHIGTIVHLALKEEKDNSWVARARTIWDAMTGKPQIEEVNFSRIVLIESNQMIYHLVGLSKEQRNTINTMSYIVTGEVDSCSQTISVRNEKGVQPNN